MKHGQPEASAPSRVLRRLLKKMKKKDLNKKQEEIIRYLREDRKGPFTSYQLWAMGVPSVTVNALIRKGYIMKIKSLRYALMNMSLLRGTLDDRCTPVPAPERSE